MPIIFFLIFFFCFIIFITGLIKPRFVFRQDNQKIAKFGYRKAIAVIFGFSASLFLILSIITVEPLPKTEPLNQKKQDKIFEPEEKTISTSVTKEIEKINEDATSIPKLKSTENSPKPVQQEPTVEIEIIPKQENEPVQQPLQGQIYIVAYIVDGDTIELENGKRVRLIGINTPESGQSYFSEARNKLIELVLNKNVRLEKDITDIDQYGRLLRYIYVGDLFVNLEMVRLGYANSYTYPPDVKYQDQFLAAEREARNQQLGLWKLSENSSEKITVLSFHPDAAGDDHENLNDEYFILKNSGSSPVDMTNWTAKDAATHIYTFPDFTLNAGATVTIYVGSGTNNADKLYWGNNKAIWNNGGDTLYLRNANGDLVLEYSY